MYQRPSPAAGVIGQERATRAVEFGMNMANAGHNIYVAGLSGTGKTSMVKAHIERVITKREDRGDTFDLDDWCYLYNCREPDSPQIISLARGKGKAFREEIADLLSEIRQGLGRAFSGDDYPHRLLPNSRGLLSRATCC